MFLIICSIDLQSTKREIFFARFETICLLNRKSFLFFINLASFPI